jgi:type III pantothenate kinase
LNVLIDLGNSRLKWAEQDPGLWRTGAAPLAGADFGALLDEAWKKISTPRKVVVCSVSAPQRLHALEQWIRTRWSVAPHVLRPRPEQLGVKNGYRDPSQLGADRWAALIGARGLITAAVCIVDCGTAVTVEALSADGEFLGGAVLPGLRLARESLAHGTESIGATDGDAADCLARTTADGVAAGTLFGLAGAVDRLLEEYRRTLGGTAQVFLTGGDAPLLAPRLRTTVTLEPDLVLKGLARVADTL